MARRRTRLWLAVVAAALALLAGLVVWSAAGGRFALRSDTTASWVGEVYTAPRLDAEDPALLVFRRTERDSHDGSEFVHLHYTPGLEPYSVRLRRFLEVDWRPCVGFHVTRESPCPERPGMSWWRLHGPGWLPPEPPQLVRPDEIETESEDEDF